MTKHERMERAFGLFLESVYRPDHDLRAQAHEQECFYELMEIREYVLEYLNTELRGKIYGS